MEGFIEHLRKQGIEARVCTENRMLYPWRQDIGMQTPFVALMREQGTCPDTGRKRHCLSLSPELIPTVRAMLQEQGFHIERENLRAMFIT